jgi:hypothetical protein
MAKETKATQLSKQFNDAIDSLIDQIESGKVTDEIKAFAVQCGKFTHYSLTNQMLIWIRDPKATQVAGFKAWHKFGRHVKKGERGIGVIAPHTYKATNSEGVEKSQIGFHKATVFDVRQTDGDDLLDVSHVDGDTGEEIYSSMKVYAESLNMPVTECEMEPDGSCSRTDIKIKESISMTNKVGVLAHELAHHLLKHHDQEKPTNIEEYEAEFTAYVVCTRFGIENKAPHYLKGWGATRDQIKEAVGVVSRCIQYDHRRR